MKRHIALFAVIAISLALLAGGSAAVLYATPSIPFWLPIAVLVVLLIGLLILLLRIKRVYTDWLKRLVVALDPEDQTALQRFPLPAVLLGADGSVLYANHLFIDQVTNGAGLIFGDLFEEISLADLTSKEQLDLVYGNRKYTVFVSKISKRHECQYVVYFIDDTDLKDIAEEYAASRPVVLQMCIDNLEEATEHLGTGDRAQISGRIESLIEDMVTAGNGLFQRYGNERFVVITEQRHLQRLMDDGFPILDRIRESSPECPAPITMSIGVGIGETISECRRVANKSLSMALSRGGSQAVVRLLDGYKFFGGHALSEKRRTKVASRMVAHSLRDYIVSSDCVIVVGHRMSDLDSVGSAVALAATARRLGCKAYACVRRKATMAGRLIDYLSQGGKSDLFIEPEKAAPLITDNSLLIVVDNHTLDRLDAPELYDKFHRTVIIDHHLMGEHPIEKPTMFHHSPSASSTCELVAELLPYMCDHEIDRLEAEALLSGIILDSRNFVLNTGELTFEAAAYLKSRNADTIAVKKLFSECIEFYQHKNDLVSSATMYRGMIIAVSEQDYAEFRAAAAQAADDLLYLPDVEASFVITRLGSEWNISARSFGEGCNVSIIMEALGGGGHKTMAATQMKDVTLDAVQEQLRVAIDEYYKRENKSTDN